MCLIFSLSAETADASSQTSGSLIAAVLEFFYPDFDNLSQTEQQELIAPFQFIARKTAHFSLYAVLGIFAFLSTVTYTKINLLHRSAIAGGICLLYAISDEVHQLFVPGRSCEIRDVLIDFCGAMLAVSLLFLVTKFSKIRFTKKYT
ncbi:MAG: VanZ family protein [Clostridia bacterium]|nr:VanZ family protein [Clostridia bacterium]